ncbi:P-type conjugative transfer protein TrbL [Luteibacter jiangsuensis]
MAIAVVLNVMVISSACADPIEKSAVISEVIERLNANQLDETILEAAKALFWSLAAISLVWTMGALIVRQDIGELLMELLRFIIVTGLFYWLLVNASSRQGGEDFVGDIVASFLQMATGVPSNETVKGHGDGVMSKGLIAYFDVLLHTGDGEDPDRVLSGLIAIAILCVCSVMAAQFLLTLVMAWILGYAGIFLLGFGGARWTSSIAINYYKHVVAVGAALLVLSLAGAITGSLLDDIGQEGVSRNYAAFASLGMMLGVSILMMVVSVKVPQMIYTLVTGSVVGLYAGSANAAGTAIAAGGSSAYAAATGRFPTGGGAVPGGSVPGGSAGSGTSLRTESVMDAVHRSASIGGGMADPFHVNSGADSFGVARAPDVHRSGARRGSVFGPMSVDESSTAAGPSGFGKSWDVSSASHSSSVDRRTASQRVPAQGAPKPSSIDMSGKQDSSASVSGSVNVNETTPNEYVTTTRTAGGTVPATSDAAHYGDASVSGAVVRRHQVRTGEANHDSEHTRTIDVLRSRGEASMAASATVHVRRSENIATTLTAARHEAPWQGDANAPFSSAEMQASRIAPKENSPDLPAATPVQDDRRAAPTSEEMGGGVRATIVDTRGNAARTAVSTTQERHAVDAKAPTMDTGIDTTTSCNVDLHNPVSPVAMADPRQPVAAVDHQTEGHADIVDRAAGQPTPSPAMRAAAQSTEILSIPNDLDARSDSDALSSSVQDDGAAAPMRSGRAPGVSQGLNTARPPTSVAQEDMKATPHSEERRVIMPGAIVGTAASVHAQTSSEDAAVSGDQPPSHRKRRARRQPNEAPPAMPPVDSEEPSDEDKP